MAARKFGVGACLPAGAALEALVDEVHDFLDAADLRLIDADDQDSVLGVVDQFF